MNFFKKYDASHFFCCAFSKKSKIDWNIEVAEYGIWNVFSLRWKSISKFWDAFQVEMVFSNVWNGILFNLNCQLVKMKMYFIFLWTDILNWAALQSFHASCSKFKINFIFFEKIIFICLKMPSLQNWNALLYLQNSSQNICYGIFHFHQFLDLRETSQFLSS